ncbi:hypothetical protein FIU97_09455 [Roseivivax sp. THAF40]|uniref:hypothetical protein n=1 Tax=Roseivivax sp. THAF40 TaxID=2587858 RepID=UPI00126955B3|nr:hypothetical protein [Roseivivax sp. THAF40]QFT46797.1 hypothetical protein FIU97_09455 [Roseivivax sp. THAF40]
MNRASKFNATCIRHEIGICRINRRLRALDEAQRSAFRQHEGTSLWQDCRALGLLGISIDGETIEDRIGRVMTDSQRELTELRHAIERAAKEVGHG